MSIQTSASDSKYISEYGISESLVINMLDDFNVTSPTTEITTHVNSLPSWHVALFGVFACCISTVTVGGNLIVILSFVLERNIRQPTNYFIASLAVSDLLIGSVSMPFYTIYLLSGQYWPLGEHLCDLWLSVDYTACLCSIYTVFCITADRFCSVKFPAKYRRWRTKEKILTIIGFTWLVPMAVFFTSIFGWQHFVKRRTVPAGKCYVQYMEDSLFNCLLQVGYFWITLTAMFVLYMGIYRIALDLHRRSAAQKAKTMSCLVSMAGRTVTQIGTVISITRRPCRMDYVKRFSPIGGMNRAGAKTGNKQVSSDYDMSKSTFIPGTCSSAEESIQLLPFWIKGRNNTAEYSSPARNYCGNVAYCSALEKKPTTLDGDLLGGGSSAVIDALKPKASHELISKSDSIKTNCDRCGRNDGNICLDNTSNESTPAIKSDHLFYSSELESCGKNVGIHISFDRPTQDGDTRGDVHHVGCFVNSAAYAVTAAPEELLNLRYADDDERNSITEHKVHVNPIVAVTNPTGSDHLAQCSCSVSTLLASSSVEVEKSLTTSSILPEDRARETKPVIKLLADDRMNVLLIPGVNCTNPLLIHHKGQGQSPSHPLNELSDDSGDAIEMCSNNLHNCAFMKGSSSEAKTNLPKIKIYQQSKVSSNLLRPPHWQKQTKRKNTEQKRDPSPSKSQMSIVKYVFQQGGTTSSTESQRTTETRQLFHNDNRTRKALRTITIILGTFVVCWIPWHVLSMIIGFCNDSKRAWCGVEPLLYDISYWLCYLNSPLNPFCYAFANQQFKKTFVRILKLDWRRN